MSAPSESALVERLRHPFGPISTAALAEHWGVTAVRVVCVRPHDLEETPVLPLRIRGAWGRALAASVTADRRRRSGRLSGISAFDALFENVYNWSAGRPVPRPFVIDVDFCGDHILVELRLFGFARLWADDAREALLLALAQGIKIRDGGRMHVQLEPFDCFMRSTEGVAVDPQAGSVRLRFLTPFALRSRGSDRFGASSLLMSLANRISGLARWHDLEIAEDWKHLKLDAERLTTDGSETWPVQWDRHSRRQPGVNIPVSAAMGTIALSGSLDAFLPLLRMGETCFAGSHCALGLGRYQLAVLPN